MSLSTPTSILHHHLLPLSPLRHRRWPLRTCQFLRAEFTNSATRLRPRVPIGRIEPKRIVVQGGDLQASIWKPIIFATGLSATAYIAAAILTNEDTDKWTKKLKESSWWRRSDSPSDGELRAAKTLEKAKRMQSTLDSLPDTLRFLPSSIPTPLIRIYISLSESYLSSPPSRLVCLSIVGFNVLVFLGWKIPAMRGSMEKWWLHWPVGRNARVVTLATSIFSHQSLPHLAFNSIALYSFGSAAYTFLSQQEKGTIHLPSSTSSYHFVAFFLVAGLASSLSSHLSTVLFRLPKLLRSLSNSSSTSFASISSLGSLERTFLPSLGASGAIYGALTMTALAYPDASVSLIFLPMIPIPIGMGMGAMVLVDLLGVIRGWKMFDHVAHLGGAAFGVLYYAYGKEFWTWLRLKLGAGKKVIA